MARRGATAGRTDAAVVGLDLEDDSGVRAETETETMTVDWTGQARLGQRGRGELQVAGGLLLRLLRRLLRWASRQSSCGVERRKSSKMLSRAIPPRGSRDDGGAETEKVGIAC